MQPSFTPFDAFVLRTPLLPQDVLRELHADLSARAAYCGGLLDDATLQRDLLVLSSRLRRIALQPHIQEALLIATPTFLAELRKWLLADGPSDRGRVERSFLKYLLRMSMRSTPFGLFAGYTIGRTSDQETLLSLRPLSDYRRIIRLSYEYHSAMAAASQRAPSLTPNSRYRTNSTAYTALGDIRYVRPGRGAEGVAFSLTRVLGEPHLIELLDVARHGAQVSDLIQVAMKHGATREESLDYLSQLIQADLLESDVGPILTHPIPSSVGECTTIEPNQAASANRPIDAALCDFEGLALGQAERAYERLEAAIADTSKLPFVRAIQVDLNKPGEDVRLGPDHLGAISAGIEALVRTSSHEPDVLRDFREHFARHFGERRVPLALALDPAFGIPISSSAQYSDESELLLKGLPFDRGIPPRGSWGARDAVLLEGLLRVTENRLLEWELKDADLERLSDDRAPRLPELAHVLLSLLATNLPTDAMSSPQVVIEHVAGPSGAHLFTRFCGNDAELSGIARRLTDIEQSRVLHAQLAEVVYVPKPRLGNVTSRPVLRSNEIVYLGRSGAPPAQQLHLDDLSIEVRADRVRLFSDRLDSEILPRITNAHAAMNDGNLPIYQFLYLLQFQGLAPTLRWRWASLDQAPFLPRVTYGRAVLARAQWRVLPTECESGPKPSLIERFESIQAIRERRRLPRWVALAQGDNVLSLDLDNVICTDILHHELLRSRGLNLQEALPVPGAGSVRNPEGTFAGEIVLPLVRMESTATSSVRPTIRAPHLYEQNRLVPGSNCGYIKIYCSWDAADSLLVDFFAPALRRLMIDGHIQSWFFLRYRDPDTHLRFRVFGQPRSISEHAIPLLNEAAAAVLRECTAWRIQWDTYEPETMRFGGPAALRHVERIFHAHSESVTATLERLREGRSIGGRWRAALIAIDTFMTDVPMTIDARLALVSALRLGLHQEMSRSEVGLARALSSKFRRHRSAIESALCPASTDDAVRECRSTFGASASTVEAWNALRDLEDRRALSAPLSTIVGSVSHLLVNRLLSHSHREQELVLYDFLARAYRSRLARAATGLSATAPSSVATDRDHKSS